MFLGTSHSADRVLDRGTTSVVDHWYSIHQVSVDYTKIVL